MIARTILEALRAAFEEAKRLLLEHCPDDGPTF